MNELVPRSKTRGMAPADRFNTRICIMLSPAVHLLFTRHVLDIVPADVDDGANGTVRFEVRDDTSPLWHAFLDACIARRIILRWESKPWHP